MARRRRYRVAHLITRLDLGGAQQNTLFCAEHHDRERFDVELVAGGGGRLDPLARQIPHTRLALVPWLRHPISPQRDLVALVRLCAHFRRSRPDLVHTHSSKAGVLGRCAAAVAGVPRIVHTVHGWSFNRTQSPTRRRAYVELERACAALSDKLIVVSTPNREEGLRAGVGRPDQYEVLYSGIDLARFGLASDPRAATRRSLGFSDEHVVVGTVSCLKPQKAPLDFVRAAAEAYRAEPRLRFFIAGDGELRPQVEGLARELGLNGALTLLGWRDDVPGLLAAMDVFLLTSLHEGLPRVVLEALAAGVPVVATAVDGTPEVIEHGTSGLLVPPARPAAAAAGVLALAASAELRRQCAQGGRARLDERFDIRAMVRRLDGIYLSLLEGDRWAAAV